MSEFIEKDIKDLRRGDRIRARIRGTETVIPGLYFETDGDFLYFRPDGASNNLPVDFDDWEIHVEKTYPMPEKTDIEHVIYNTVNEAVSKGENTEYGTLAEKIMQLIRGEIATPVPVFVREVVDADTPEPIE